MLALAGSPQSSSLWFVVALCLAASAFLSFSETCLTSLSESKIHALMAERGKRAGVLNLWLREPHAILVTILVGNTLANILATAIVTQLVLVAWGERAVSYAVGLMTFVVLMAGEIMPKTLARQHAVQAAVPTLHLLRIFHVILTPITLTLTQMTRILVRLLGSRLDASRDISEAEVEAMVDLGRREGILTAAKTDMLRAVFRLGDRSAREVMVTRTDVVAVDLRRSVPELVALARESGHSRLPAHEGSIDDIVGILHAKDLLHRVANDSGAIDVRALLRDPLFVPESMKLDALLRHFRRSHQHLAVVLDEFGGTSGIATLEDILEQVVGEIWDEHDEEEEAVVVRGGSGRWTVDGRLPLAELAKLGIEVDRDADYETVAGLLMDVLGHVPTSGTVVSWRGHRFEVLGADERRITQVRISREDEPAAPATGTR